MDDFEFLCKTSDIPENKMKEFTQGEKKVLIINSGNKFYAMDGLCTHEHCPLEKGEVEGNILTCPCHGGQFDIRSGDAVSLPPIEALETYEVKEENGEVLVKLTD